jgi:hypothetical protein
VDDSLESAVIRKGSPVDANEIGRIFVRARDEMTYERGRLPGAAFLTDSARACGL